MKRLFTLMLSFLTLAAFAALDPPTGLKASVSSNNVHLTWNTPGVPTGDVEELIYDHDNATGAYKYQGYALSTHMSPQAPCQILTLKYYIVYDLSSGNFNAEVYRWGSSAPTTELLISKPVTANMEGWIEVDLTDDHITTTGDFVVGFGSINDNTYVGYDGNYNNGRSWDFDHQGNWTPWTEAYLVRAVVQYYDGVVRELSAVPAAWTPGVAPVLARTARTGTGSLNTVVPVSATRQASRGLLGYNIYRDGTKINNTVVTELFYNDNGLEPGTYQYTARALYDEGESENSNTAVAVIGGGNNLKLDFEDLPDFSITFGNWTAVDRDGGATYGFDGGITFPHNFEPMAFIAFNQTATTPPMTGLAPHGGARFGACFSSEPPVSNNDWMISPRVLLGDNPALNLWVKSYTDAYGLEKYKILVSETDMEPSSFTTIAGPLTAPADDWTYVSYSLDNYTGKEVYVAIQCVSSDNFVFMIDDVEITFTVDAGKQELPVFSVYPNPSYGVLNIQGDSRIEAVKLVNTAGQVVYESTVNEREFSFSTAGMAQGLYLLNITTEKGLVTRKVSIR